MEISNSPQPVSWTSKVSPGGMFSIAARKLLAETVGDQEMGVDAYSAHDSEYSHVV
jgi:hypothetical protein